MRYRGRNLWKYCCHLGLKLSQSSSTILHHLDETTDGRLVKLLLLELMHFISYCKNRTTCEAKCFQTGSYEPVSDSQLPLITMTKDLFLQGSIDLILNAHKVQCG